MTTDGGDESEPETAAEEIAHHLTEVARRLRALPAGQDVVALRAAAGGLADVLTALGQAAAGAPVALPLAIPTAVPTMLEQWDARLKRHASRSNAS